MGQSRTWSESELDLLTKLKIETPSWGYANSGTRFGSFKTPGSARTIWEKLVDAGQVHKLTGLAPSVAVHIPWDKVDDYEKLGAFAKEQGVEIGSINPNLFQDQDYRLGSLTNLDESIRQRAIDHCIECIEIMKKVGSKTVSLWLPDGTNYVGQGDLITRKHLLEDSLKKIYGALPSDATLLVEYKFFEPAFYFTDLFDWGVALLHCQKLGPQAKVLVDLGHHAQGVNIEAIVAYLIDEKRLGGFHFNNRKYADDDLIVGSTNPFELFCIFYEIIAAHRRDSSLEIAYMIDQSHTIEPKVEAMLQSVINVQNAYAKAILIDFEALEEAQKAGDVLLSHRLLKTAFEADVTDFVIAGREKVKVAADPISTYRQSGYQEEKARERAQPIEGAGGGLGS